uniref:EGF-like domain-containing protein n=1 Tax=Panagrellus redivivus TaxID=6233 RepID=A0A7E4ZY12_PANRE
MHLLALCFSLCLLWVSADRQFSCPNNGEPKLAEDSTPIQCLPGQNVCGRGYSCFFSGFNYACCPTAQEDYDEFNGTECPEGSIAVVDAVGAAVRCNHRTGRCPDHKMFCARQGSQAVCCENLHRTHQHYTQNSRADNEAAEKPVIKPTTRRPKPTTTTRRPTTTTTTTPKPINIMDLECPKKHLTVLADNGEPFTCSNKKKCPNSNMKCSAIKGYNICCEPLETAHNFLDDEDGKLVSFEAEDKTPSSDELNPLKYTPHDVLRVQEELFLQKEIDSAVVTDVPDVSLETRKQRKGNRNYVDNENTKYIAVSDDFLIPKSANQHIRSTTSKPTTTTTEQSISTSTAAQFQKRRPHIKEGQVRAFGVNTKTNVNEAIKLRQNESLEKQPATEGSVEYRPHNQGGYAISRKLEKINSKAAPSKAERKARVQEFLMNQIRQGWPYDEKFYHPDTIDSSYRPPRTEAVVHFDT